MIKVTRRDRLAALAAILTISFVVVLYQSSRVSLGSYTSSENDLAIDYPSSNQNGSVVVNDPSSGDILLRNTTDKIPSDDETHASVDESSTQNATFHGSMLNEAQESLVDLPSESKWALADNLSKLEMKLAGKNNLTIQSPTWVGDVLNLNETHNVDPSNASNMSLGNPSNGNNVTLLETSARLRKCLRHNSPEWLAGSRIGNDNADMTDDFVSSMLDPHQLLTNTPTLLEQTICHPDGRFRSLNPNWNSTDEVQVRDWEIRLLFLVLHKYHHQAAAQEWKARNECSSRELEESFDLKNYDYECPNAKFLVSSLPNLGMGATFRSGAMSHIFMALNSDRIPLFLSNTSTGPDYMQSQWSMASCPRGDFQCVYLPTSPCVITEEDLTNATVLDKPSARKLRNFAVLDDAIADERIIVFQTKLTPVKVGPFEENLRKKLAAIALEIVQEWRDGLSEQADASDEQWRILKAAAVRIANRDLAQNGTNWYSYSFRENRVAHAIMMYLMRPNMLYRRLVQETVDAAVPNSTDPERTLGLPIRASDKCELESTCLTFDQYMELMRRTWDDKNGTGRGTIILTSEDKMIFRRRIPYAQNESFPFDFVVNTNDVQQGTGRPRYYKSRADAIMLSSLVAIKMQLYASHVIGNCCSNFHNLLFDFVKEGCGASGSTTLCLQETEDPQFHVCCNWVKTEECESARESYWKRFTYEKNLTILENMKRAERKKEREETKKKQKEKSKKAKTERC